MHSFTIPVGEFSHLTFDCYGTLIDWESGILNTLTPLMSQLGVEVTPEELLTRFVRHEARLEAGDWQPYRQILRGVLQAIAGDLGVMVPERQRDALADELEHWPTFDDTIAALRRLKSRFKLVIVSNIDDALFAHTARRLEVPFDGVVTAEQVQSYKPKSAHFLEMLRRLNAPVTRVLHVAQSLYHDHVPAQGLGIRTAWVNRSSRLVTTGLAPAASASPHLTARDLAGIADQLGV